jgi:tRNA A-37 threonylcarbamoyl transferase component Bud32
MEPLSASDPQAVGEFQLRARLGAGGMGRVYLGYSRAGRAVAVKVIHPELARDPEFRLRFSREVAAARAVSGMYTAPVVASGVDADPPWLATAYVPGPSLSDVVNRHGPLPEAATWRLAAGLAEALGAVHACGLVHRDLKPANVLLAADGPHVIDFGISRACDGTSVTATGSVVGTPGYMSPEQAEGAQAGPASDVFSLGCVLAYAATGDAPFGTGSAASVLYRVVTAQPDLTRVAPRLRNVITACLAKDPGQRPGLAALGTMIAQAGPAVTASPTSFWPDPVAEVIRGADTCPTRVTPPSGGVSPAQPAQPAASGSRPGMVPDGYLAAATASLTTQRAARGHTHPMTAPAQGAAWPQPAGAPWAQTPAADALSRYTPAPPRPRPPTSVLAAAWLMYSGAGLSVLAALVDLAIIGQVKTAFLASHPLLPGNTVRSFAAGASAGVLVGGGVIVASWLWLAFASKQGAGWARTVGTVLFGIDTFLMVATLGTRGIGVTKGIGTVVWLIALVTVILLWQRSASRFFAARR